MRVQSRGSYDADAVSSLASAGRGPLNDEKIKTGKIIRVVGKLCSITASRTYPVVEGADTKPRISNRFSCGDLK